MDITVSLDSFAFVTETKELGYRIELEKIIPKGKHYWKVLKNYSITINGWWILIPQGFQTDLASIPKVLRSLISKDGRHIIAAVIHDLLYRLKAKRPFKMSRKFADAVFKNVMQQTYVNAFIYNTMWLGVRSGGWASWVK